MNRLWRARSRLSRKKSLFPFFFTHLTWKYVCQVLTISYVPIPGANTGHAPNGSKSASATGKDGKPVKKRPKPPPKPAVSRSTNEVLRVSVVVVVVEVVEELSCRSTVVQPPPHTQCPLTLSCCCVGGGMHSLGDGDCELVQGRCEACTR